MNKINYLKEFEIKKEQISKKINGLEFEIKKDWNDIKKSVSAKNIFQQVLSDILKDQRNGTIGFLLRQKTNSLLNGFKKLKILSWIYRIIKN